MMFGLMKNADHLTTLAEMSGMRDAQAIVLRIGTAAADKEVKVAALRMSDEIDRAIKAKERALSMPETKRIQDSE